MEAEEAKLVPIFVLMAALPTRKCPLHIFEPRYRLMMRRALESTGCFGMCAAAEGGFADHGTLLRIEDFRLLPDGRSALKTVGVKRFRVLERSMRDGYHQARVEWLDDDCQEDDEEVSPEIAEWQGKLKKQLQGLRPILTKHPLGLYLKVLGRSSELEESQSCRASFWRVVEDLLQTQRPHFLEVGFTKDGREKLLGKLQQLEDQLECSLTELAATLDVHEGGASDHDQLPIILMDSMLPGQRLKVKVPADQHILEIFAPQAQFLESGKLRAGMVGMDLRTQGRLSRGTEVLIRRTSEDCLEFIARRRFEITSEVASGECRVSWCSSRDELEAAAVEESTALEPLVEEWKALAMHFQRFPDQLEQVTADLGEMPPAQEVVKRCFWIAALINPLPVMGVAPEIRPAALMAETVQDLCTVVKTGLTRSIANLKARRLANAVHS